MRPAANAKIARALSDLGYRWAGLKRAQQKRSVVVICATAAPMYDNDAPSLSVCSTTEKVAVDGLLAAVRDLRE